ncbi:unnamed protein product [Urochloa decumbens]|uniref:Type 2 DNA topoisomerase 6 subunit B-like n=1 Tax=Urochloa decumbens TaxID=240449 RepID=A0ABC9DK24_9POAL
MASVSSPHRKLLHFLVYWAVQRCRVSESPCRLTFSLKRPAESASPSQLRVSVSDTGVRSKLEEFLELNDLARETPVEKWDGTLLITTTGINDEAIYRYRFNLHEELSSARFSRLATTYKNHATFSGTEVCLCLSNEADADDLILWLVGFFHKILVLRAANLACELFVEQIGNAESRNVCLPQDSDDVHHSVMASSSDRLVSGLKDYALSHGYNCDKCDTCILNRDLLKTGTGAANNVDRRKAKGAHVEVVILIARTASDLSCWAVNCSSTQGSQQDRHLVRKALKSALSHLKADHAGDFLSCHGQRVREYVPDLAESIAGLILSSNDKEFHDECVSLLGLGSDQDISEELVQSSICEKMIRIIELNDTKENVEDNAPYLFECEKLDEDSQLDEEDRDEDMIFDF